jgi:hypothetical protein
MDWIIEDWIEIIGAILTLLFLYLEVTRKWTMWIVGILSGLFYIYINSNVRLYALAGMNVFNVIMSIYGLYCWRFLKTEEKEVQGSDKKQKGVVKGKKKGLDDYQLNFTDSESRIMKAGTGKTFEQSYNAEAAVDTEGSMLILGGYVTNHGNDKQELAPCVESVDKEIRRVNSVTSDTGFYGEEAVKAVEKPDENGKNTGPEVYCAVEKTGHHRSVEDLEKKTEPRLKKGATAKEKMAHKLRTKVGKAIYKKRKETVEPVFGIIKGVMGFRQFMLRGLEKVNTEWTLVRAAYNFKKLHRLSYGITVPFCPVRG